MGDKVINFLWDNPLTAEWVLTLIAFLAIYAFLFFMYAKIVKRKTGYIFLAVTFTANLLFLLFSLTYVFIVGAILTGVGVTITLFTNLGDLRQFLANPFKGSRVKSGKVEVEKGKNGKVKKKLHRKQYSHAPNVYKKLRNK